jgi:hypothetical protein
LSLRLLPHLPVDGAIGGSVADVTRWTSKPRPQPADTRFSCRPAPHLPPGRRRTVAAPSAHGGDPLAFVSGSMPTEGSSPRKGLPRKGLPRERLPKGACPGGLPEPNRLKAGRSAPECNWRAPVSCLRPLPARYPRFSVLPVNQIIFRFTGKPDYWSEWSDGGGGADGTEESLTGTVVTGWAWRPRRRAGAARTPRKPPNPSREASGRRPGVS